MLISAVSRAEQIARSPDSDAAQALQRMSGVTIQDMQVLAEKIRSGEDTWEQVFSGESPNGSLLQGHLTKMFEEHKDDLTEDMVREMGKVRAEAMTLINAR